MSLDKSLKSRDSLVRHRNVLTRAERLVKLEEEERWSEDASVLGLPKVIHRKAVLAKKTKEKAADATEAVEGATETPEQAAGSDEAKKTGDAK